MRTLQEAFLINGAENPNQPVSPAAPAIPRATTSKTVLTWVGVSFVIPTIFIVLLHQKLEPNNAVITLAAEIPARLISAFAVLIGTWLAARMDKKSLADYGAPPQKAFGARFWEGCVWGFAMLSAVVLIIRLTGHFEILSVALSGRAEILKYGAGWAIAFWGVAINEEFLFRCYLLRLYTRRTTFWQGSLILSALFGAAHLGNPNENAFGILQVVVVGMIFCLTIRRTGTLWLAVGFHAAWDWAQTFFYGTADSGLMGQGHLLNTTSEGPKWITGGGAGPEGSVIAFGVLLLFALLVHLRFPKALYLTAKEQQAAQAQIQTLPAAPAS